MTKDAVRKRIIEIGIIPVVRVSSAKHAFTAAEALCAGGIPIVEITMTVPGAIELIAQLAKAGDAMLIGAGTVLDVDTAERCIDAGSQFIVSPGLDVATVIASKARGILMMAGALTPSEILAAWNAGSDFVKVFPCDAVGGARYIKSVKGPLPHIPLVPTGGVNLANLADLIRAGAEAVGVGGELVSKAALSAGKLDEITAAAAKYVAAVHEARQPSVSDRS
ncbi:MAG TPA: bifunctional 4-hydroxy-2-oxoglutarate aldolase/2-dehydro-3-deoxy-phosphogluconate aldolase [Candidatus Acidoferrales bacterium]|jgi:2-dehydro-3-deoxyphosphogluconate aldolase/(4S)-4-hydroxy-2-oxoglutarate aldolase|nr:bifunctional 4-hydroxy-2-oxoglutarate aldolase/2-dehydro-3-deoxy-phosphogluconate aldolase [Candidatus Acidoferrales bacterium]